MFRYILLLSCLISIFSCNIEKRHYRPGFYIPRISEMEQVSVPEHVDDQCTTKPSEKNEAADPPAGQGSICENNAHPKTKDSQVRNSVGKPGLAKFTPAHFLNPISPKIGTAKNAHQFRRIDNDELFIIGVVVFCTGLAMLVLAIVFVATDPLTAGPLLLIGLVVFSLGFAISTIADPSVGLDILLDILEALLKG